MKWGYCLVNVFDILDLKTPTCGHWEVDPSRRGWGHKQPLDPSVIGQLFCNRDEEVESNCRFIPVTWVEIRRIRSKERQKHWTHVTLDVFHTCTVLNVGGDRTRFYVTIDNDIHITEFVSNVFNNVLIYYPVSPMKATSEVDIVKVKRMKCLSAVMRDVVHHLFRWTDVLTDIAWTLKAL